MKAIQFTIILFASVFYNQSFAQTETVESVGTEYLSAYRSGQVKNMMVYMADDATFEDRTAELTGASLNVTGRKQIRELLLQLNGAVEIISFDKKFEFVSGSYFVSAGNFKYIGNVSPSQKMEIEVMVLTLLEFDNLKVKKHSDFAGYEDVMKKIQSK